MGSEFYSELLHRNIRIAAWIDNPPVSSYTENLGLIIGGAMDQIGNMAAFVKVVETGSFVRAARLLRLSSTMVSKHVRALEERLGTRLLHRTTRRISLTEAGTLFYERCAELLLALEELEDSASDIHVAPRGLLRVSAPTMFGACRIAPLLPALAERYPGLSVELTLIDRPVDPVQEGVDIAVIIGDVPQMGYMTWLLAMARTVVCAAPDYLERHGAPSHPAELAGHNCFIHTGWLLTQGWDFSDADGPLPPIRITGNFRTNGFFDQHTAALAGHGLAVLPRYFVDPDLRSGRLVAVLTDFEGPRMPLRLVYPSGRQLPAKTRVFIDSLVEAVARERDLLE